MVINVINQITKLLRIIYVEKTKTLVEILEIYAQPKQQHMSQLACKILKVTDKKWKKFLKVR